VTRVSIHFVRVLLLLAATTSAVMSQVAPKPAATPKRDAGVGPGPARTPVSTLPTGSIKGQVVSEDGRPITNASVGASTSVLSQKLTRVDSEGRFALEELPAAPYSILAIAPGYIDQTLLDLNPDLSPKHLIGSQVRIVMIKGGVVTGTVTDAKGQPVVGAPISATPVSGVSGIAAYMFGTRTVAETDDRGIYRLYGLPPGQFTIAAGGGGPYSHFNVSGFELDVPTFYPSATRDTAVAVNVHAGEELSGIDIRYRGLEGHTISGTVIGTLDNNSGAGNAISLMLTHSSTSSVLSFSVVGALDQQRAFQFDAVGDGEYDLFAMFMPDPTADPLVGTKRVTVRGADVTGVEIGLSKFGSITGTLALDPIKPENKCDKRGSFITETNVSAPRDEPRKAGSQVLTQLFSFYGNTLNAKGEFVARNLDAGRYRLTLGLPTEAWYIRSITLPKPPGTRPAEAWQGVVTVRSGERVGPFTVAIGQDAAGLRGRIELSEQKTIPAGLRVHLVPAERDDANNVLRYSESAVESDGSFKFANLAPGRYLILAIQEPVDEKQPATPRRPVAFDPLTRNKVRREAETANVTIELKPCRQLVDYKLSLKPNQ
jgi:hypothetical protein